MIRVTYQKNDGCIIQRERTTMLPYQLGDITSMGWKVLNIERKYKDAYYSLHEYNTLLEKNKQKLQRKKKMVELCTNEIKTLLYCFIAVVIINFLKIFFGV